MWNTLTHKTKALLGIMFGVIIITLIVVLSISRQQRRKTEISFFSTSETALPEDIYETEMVAIRQAEIAQATNEADFFQTSQAVLPTSTPTPILQTATDATIPSQTSNVDVERLYATLDVLSEDVGLLSSDIEELKYKSQHNTNSNQQAIQILVDHIQNLTTLAVSLLVIVPALIERVFTKPKAKGIIAISIIAFVITIIGALASQYSVFVVATTFLYTKIANITLFIAWGAFLIGIVSLAAFAIVNLFNDGKTNKEVAGSSPAGGT